MKGEGLKRGALQTMRRTFSNPHFANRAPPLRRARFFFRAWRVIPIPFRKNFPYAPRAMKKLHALSLFALTLFAGTALTRAADAPTITISKSDKLAVAIGALGGADGAAAAKI